MQVRVPQRKAHVSLFPTPAAPHPSPLPPTVSPKYGLILIGGWERELGLEKVTKPKRESSLSNVQNLLAPGCTSGAWAPLGLSLPVCASYPQDHPQTSKGSRDVEDLISAQKYKISGKLKV